MRYLISDHAVERYVERVHPGVPLKQIPNPKDALDEARRTLEGFSPQSTSVREKTRSGQEQRRLDRPKPCVLVCKHDPGAIAVVTVLGPNETLAAADEEIVEAWERHLVDSFAERAMKNVKRELASTPKPNPNRAAALSRITDEAVRRMVAPMVRNEIGPVIDKLVKLEMDRRNKETTQATDQTLIVTKEREKTERLRMELESAARKQAEKTERHRMNNNKRDHILHITIRTLDRLASESDVATEALARVVEVDPTIRGMIGPKEGEPS